MHAQKGVVDIPCVPTKYLHHPALVEQNTCISSTMVSSYVTATPGCTDTSEQITQNSWALHVHVQLGDNWIVKEIEAVYNNHLLCVYIYIIIYIPIDATGIASVITRVG